MNVEPEKQKNNNKPIRQFNKVDCQLSQFPVIKLHIFQNIQILNLSNNSISNLKSLEVHNQTSQYTLSHLRVVNLSKNHFSDVQALIPLAKAAKQIRCINVQSNPLEKTINFLYKISVIFKSMQQIQCGQLVKIDQFCRQKMIEHQMVGGRLIFNFLQYIKDKTQTKYHKIPQQQINKTQRFLLQLTQNEDNNSISQTNNIIFHNIEQFLIQNRAHEASQTNTYRSPRSNRRKLEIQTKTEYQISNSPNQLLRYLTEDQEKEVSIVTFYYDHLASQQKIQQMILQSMELQQEEQIKIEKGDLNGFTIGTLIEQFNQQWRHNLTLTNQFQSQLLNNHHQMQRSISPFKSIQTDNTSRAITNEIMHSRAIANQTPFFGLDREWTKGTVDYIKQRLKSFFKIIIEKSHLIQSKERQIVQSKDQDDSLNQLSKQKPINQFLEDKGNEEFKYQTFGANRLQPLTLQSQQIIEYKSILSPSPKSKNKYIGRLFLKIIDNFYMKHFFNKIIVKSIQQIKVANGCQAILKVIKKVEQKSFRKIYQSAIYFECLSMKMDFYKKRAIFKAWKQIKVKKLKLLKAIASRKTKKEKAFLSVFLTQWRITSRNIQFEQKLRRRQVEYFNSQCPIQDLSCILKRAATCKKLPSRHIDKKWQNNSFAKKCRKIK